MSESAYLKIAENVDAGPLTAPKADGDFSKAFVKFLSLLYTPEEAALVQHLKMGARSMLSADDIARLAGKSATEVADLLEPLALRGRTRWDNPRAVAPSNFIAESSEDCVMCGHCADRCFFDAIALDEDQGKSIVDAEKCMGCGVCTITCDQEALRLKRVERERPFPTARELARTIAADNRERERAIKGGASVARGRG